MKPKTLLILVLIFAALFGLSLLRPGSRTELSQSGWEPGDQPFVALDLNAARSLELQQGDARVSLNFTNGVWVVEELYGYPADFQKLAEVLRGLPERKVGRELRDAATYLDELGLVPDEQNPPTSFQLLNDQGAVFFQVLLGSPQEASTPGNGRGQFVQLMDDSVVLLDEALSGLDPVPSAWLDRSLIDLETTNLVSVTVENGEESYRLNVLGRSQFELEDLGDDETLKAHEPRRVARALQRLQFADVVDPASPKEELGFEQGPRYIAKTLDGLVYTLQFGRNQASGNNRYVKIDVDYEQPAEPVLEDVADRVTDSAVAEADGENLDEAALNDRLLEELEKEKAVFQETVQNARERAELEKEKYAPWIYTIMNYNAESMTMPRSNLVDLVQPEVQEPNEGK